MKFAMITPTRGRPGRFAEMMESALHTAERVEDVTLYAVLDADDPELDRYLSSLPRAVVVTVQGRRERLGHAFQNGAERAMHDGAQVLMMNGDDVIFRTPNWDRAVREAFARYPDGLALVYPNDGNGNIGLHDREVRGNHWFVTRRWVEFVGCFCPSHLEHYCSDTVPERIAAAAGRLIALPDVLIEHMHFKHLKSAKDETYAYARSKNAAGVSMSDRDIARMQQLEPWIAARAAAVREAIAG